METKNVPTLGRLLHILRDLGFTTESASPGVLALVHPASGAEFLFRDRAHDSSARPNELVNLRVQLTARGLLTEKELDVLLTQTIHPATTA